MLRRYYKAEVVKNRRTAAGKLIFLMPALTAVLVVFLMPGYFAVGGYNWWYMAVYPAAMALICGMAGEKDKKMKNRAILSLPVRMKSVWDGKVMYGLRMLILSMAVMEGLSLAVCKILEQGFGVAFEAEITIAGQIAAAVFLIAAFLWQVPFCLLLQQFFGVPLSFLIHMASYAIVASSFSLKPYFMLFPGAIPARVMCRIIKVLPNGLPAVPGSATFAPELLDARLMWIGTAASVLWFVLFWHVGRILYERKGVER